LSLAVSVDVPAFLPDDFIPDTGQRLEFYRRFVRAKDEDEIRAIEAELEDRYGRLPDEAQLLREVMIDKTPWCAGKPSREFWHEFGEIHSLNQPV
jgi:transcription-repair coupling factor (superfamily II helicase)